jgi:hypothetical protein
MTRSATIESLRLRVGDVVEVRSAEEIMATLDVNGELDNLPFMPEMLDFCGRRMSVDKVATKLCDFVGKTGMHRMENAVHLTGARCSGSAHGGCQTACLLYWKEAWLKRVDPGTPESATGRRIDLPLLDTNVRRGCDDDGQPLYRCQATEIIRAAPELLPFRDMRQYVTDVQIGNAAVYASVMAFFVGLFNRLQDVSKRLLPARLRFRDGLPWGFVKGRVVGRTPTEHLDLQPGELVRIKTKEQIEATLNADRLNRGMGFEEEMSRFCGKTARVQARVTRCLDEGTGKLLDLKNPCIVLEGVVCAGAYHANCPRQYVSFWREIWLERV